jgi:conjugal transfer mating pair stabilization protein TraG
MFEIYGYGNVEALLGIFNAIAALRGSGDFLSAIAAVVVLGFLAAMIAYAIQPEKLTGWKWLASVLGVYYLLWVPTATVQVVDKQGFQPPVVVANVPFGAAALGGLSSSIGSVVTDMFETVFASLPGSGALPSELSYSQTGMMFGSRAVASSSRVAFSDPTFRTNLNNFLLSCTFYDLQDPGGVDPAAFSRSTDVWVLMAFTNGARFTPWLGGGAGSNLVSCDTAYSNLDAVLGTNVDALRDRLANSLNPSVPIAARATLTDAQIQQAHLKNGLATAAMSVTDILRQNGMVNAINDAGMLGCQRANDPACMLQAQARANSTATTNAAWINGAKISEQALPLIRNAAESMLYAMFPIIVLLLFLSTGMKTFRMLGLYIALFVSIQLWPPLFAILSYLGTQAAATQLAASGTIVGGTFGIALQNSDAIYADAVSMPAVVSYLVMSIPVLAYAIANGLVGISGGLFGAMSSMPGFITGTSGQAATGNLSMGNVSMDQRTLSPSTSSPFVTRQQTPGGDWVTTTGDGRQAVDFLRNQGAASRVVSSRVTQSDVADASRSVESARSDLFSASNELSSTLTNAVTQASSVSASTSRKDGVTVAQRSEAGQSAERIRAWSEQVQQATGVDARQAMAIGFQLSGGAGTGNALPLKFNASGQLDKNFTNSLSESEQKVAAQLTSDRVGDFKRFADSATTDQAFSKSLADESRSGEELASRLSQAVSRVKVAQAAYSEREAFANRVSSAYERGDSISVDLAQLPSNPELMQRYQDLARVYGSNSAALQAAMSSDLATQSLRPTSVTGASLPSSIADIRSANYSNIQDPAFARAMVTDAASRNDRAVGPKVSSKDIRSPTLSPELEGVRGDIQSRMSTADSTPPAGADFDARNEIVRNPDGTVTSRKSQVLQNARQLRDDAANLGSNAMEIIQGASADDARKAADSARERQANSELGRAKAATPEVPTMRPKAGRRQ